MTYRIHSISSPAYLSHHINSCETHEHYVRLTLYCSPCHSVIHQDWAREACLSMLSSICLELTTFTRHQQQLSGDLCDELRRVADISSRQRLRSSSTSALIVPPTQLPTHRWWGVSCCCFTHLEQRATSLHFSTISTDYSKKRLKPFLFSCSLRLCSRPIAAFGLNAWFVI